MYVDTRKLCCHKDDRAMRLIYELHTFLLLYKAMVRPRVEFANSVWCPYKLGDIKEIETRNPAVTGMADRTAPVVKLTRQKIVIPSGIGLAVVHSWQLDTCASVYKL